MVLLHFVLKTPDQKCRSYGKPNGLKAAKLESYTLNDGTEASTIRRLSEGPLSVAFHVGICTGILNGITRYILRKQKILFCIYIQLKSLNIKRRKRVHTL